jgi:hypothetical protein
VGRSEGGKVLNGGAGIMDLERFVVISYSRRNQLSLKSSTLLLSARFLKVSSLPPDGC